MLFCKNLVGTRSRRRGGTSTVMSDKSTSSKTPAITATETPQPSSPPRKIYPIVKYGDPVLERPGAPVQKFDAELEDLAEDMFASMRSEEHTSELQSRLHLVCRLLLEKKNSAKFTVNRHQFPLRAT